MTPLDFVFLFVSILFAMGLHEAMHGFAAHWLGDDTALLEGRLTLNPLKHVDMLTTVLLPVILIAVGLPPIFAAKPVPFNPYRVKYDEFGAALIGLAGPFTNLALAIVSAVIAHLLVGRVGDVIVNALVMFVQVNVGFFVFNMLPIPPLDGSRLLYAVAPEPVQGFMAQFERMGIGAVILILLLFMSFLGPVIGGLNEAVLRVLL